MFEQANHVAVNRFPVTAHEHFRVRIGLVHLDQRLMQLVDLHFLFVEIKVAVLVDRKTDVILLVLGFAR